MNNKKFIGSLIVLLLTLLTACTTDPVIPAGGIPVKPPIQDPGETNVCADGLISFEHQIMPIMVSACAYSGCHDAISREEGVVLDNYENIRKEVSPGNPNNSPLYEYILPNSDDLMPPPPAPLLSQEQRDLIKLWIEQGAENTDCGTPCEPTKTSFELDIYPLLQDYCVGCHSTSRTDGMVNLEGYNNIKQYVDNGGLIGTIKAIEFYPIMPPTGSQMSSCRIEQIQAWITQGALNN